jgi:hypothetical protein
MIGILFTLIILLFLWTGVLSYGTCTLTSQSDGKTLTAALDHLLKEQEMTKKDLATLQKQYDTMEIESRSHIQKIGLLRYNPFKDTGGDQSFIITLLDKEDTGILLSGLYSRSGTRWYAKKIQVGKGVGYELSDEEKKAIRIAQPIK